MSDTSLRHLRWQAIARRHRVLTMLEQLVGLGFIVMVVSRLVALTTLRAQR